MSCVVAAQGESQAGRRNSKSKAPRLGDKQRLEQLSTISKGENIGEGKRLRKETRTCTAWEDKLLFCERWKATGGFQRD